MSSLEVEADVSEANITRVVPEQGCEIRLDAYPDRRYLGYVTKIVPTADRAKATVLVKIKFKDYDNRVLPEMGAKITFLAPGSDQSAVQAKPVLAVPAAAVASRNTGPVVFQVKGGSRRRDRRRLGRANRKPGRDQGRLEGRGQSDWKNR